MSNPQPIARRPFDFFTPELLAPEDYTTSEPNFENAYICANISQLCYLSSVNARHMNIGYEEAVRLTLKAWGCSHEDIKKTIFIDSQEIRDEEGNYVADTQGLIIFHKNTAIIGFRGSEKKVGDWATNFKIRSRELDYTDKPYEPENPLAVIFSKKPRVHRGFLKAFKAILVNSKYHDSVMKQLGAAENVWLTGHSLGGAIAILAANYLLEQVEPKIHVSGVYTFGAPRVGNTHYRNLINKRLKYQYWRFMNENDPVPDLPFPELIYRYSREGCMLRLNKNNDYDILRRIDQEGKRIRLGAYHGNLKSVGDHSLSEYSKKLLYFARKKQADFPEMEFEKLSDDGKLKGVPVENSDFTVICSFLEAGVSKNLIAKALEIDTDSVEKVVNCYCA
ncbi:MAG: lipase family protein [Crocosphaera sp.]